MLRAIVSVICASLAIWSSAFAQGSWPRSTVRFFVPAPPGGYNDIVTRLLADGLTKKFGQTFVAENRAGAAGIVGVKAVLVAPSDGYTFVMTSVSQQNIAPWLFQGAGQQLGYDGVKDFTYVARVFESPNAIFVRANSPFKSLEDAIAYAKANPGKLSYSSLGIGSTNHLAGVSLGVRAGFKATHVPYSGSAPALAAVLGGDIDLGFDNVAGVISRSESGQVRILAVTSRMRLSQIPNVRTVEEMGFPDFEFGSWFGLIGPAGIPPDIVARLSGAIGEVMRTPEMIERFKQMNATPVFLAAEDFAAYAKQGLERWGTVVKAAGISSELK